MARKKKEVVVEEKVLAPVEAKAETEEVTVPYSAELKITDKVVYKDLGLEYALDGYPDNLGYIYYGNIFKDTMKHGNHPFKNGAFIHTSLVTSEEVVDGVTYVHTLNSTYRIITDDESTSE